MRDLTLSHGRFIRFITVAKLALAHSGAHVEYRGLRRLGYINGALYYCSGGWCARIGCRLRFTITRFSVYQSR